MTDPVDLQTADPAELTVRHVLVDLPDLPGRTSRYEEACIANRVTDAANVTALLKRLAASEARAARLTDELAERDAKLEAQAGELGELWRTVGRHALEILKLEGHMGTVHNVFNELTRLTGLEFGRLISNSHAEVNTYVSVAGTWRFELNPDGFVLVVSSTEDRDRQPLTLNVTRQGLATLKDTLALEAYLSRLSRDEAKEALPGRHFRQLFAGNSQGQQPDLDDEADQLGFMADLMICGQEGSFFNAVPLMRDKPSSVAAMIIAMAATRAHVDLSQLRVEYGARRD